MKRAHRVAAKVSAGTVWVNTYGMFDAAIPYGGFKLSGYGKELGREALEQYLQTKTVSGRSRGVVSFCESLRADCRDLWQAFTPPVHPRARGGARSSPSRFRFYVEQDLFFLPELARAVALGVGWRGESAEMRRLRGRGAQSSSDGRREQRGAAAPSRELARPTGVGALTAAPAAVAYSGYLGRDRGPRRRPRSDGGAASVHVELR